MQGFRQFIESSLRDQLSVSQNPSHHPEGDVARHSQMVHAAIPVALQMLKKKQQEDPDGPFSELTLDLGSDEMKMLRLAGLLHDIGKGPSVDPTTLSAHGHEDPEMFEKGMAQLGPQWQQMYEKSSPQDKADLWFIIQNHMSLSLKGLGRRLRSEMVDSNGKYLNTRRVKLLLVVFLMDRIGRGGQADFSRSQSRDFVKGNSGVGNQRIDAMYASSSDAVAQKQKELTNKSAPAPDSPEAFVALLKSRKLSPNVIRKSLQNKRPDLTQQQIDDYMA